MNTSPLLAALLLATAATAFSQTYQAFNNNNGVGYALGGTPLATSLAGNPSDSPTDLKITASVKKKLLADPALSQVGRSILVTTVKQVVTLQGVVQTEQEKSLIATHATRAGAVEVNNQLTLMR